MKLRTTMHNQTRGSRSATAHGLALLVGKVGRLWQAIPHQSEVKGMGIVKAKAGLVDVESYKPVRKREGSSPTKN